METTPSAKIRCIACVLYMFSSRFVVLSYEKWLPASVLWHRQENIKNSFYIVIDWIICYFYAFNEYENVWAQPGVILLFQLRFIWLVHSFQLKILQYEIVSFILWICDSAIFIIWFYSYIFKVSLFALCCLGLYFSCAISQNSSNQKLIFIFICFFY